MCLGTNMCGHKRVWAQSSVGTNVCGHKLVWDKRVWAQSYVGTNVCGHNRVWAQTCLGTIVCAHNRVGSVMYGHKRVVSIRAGVWGLGLSEWEDLKGVPGPCPPFTLTSSLQWEMGKQTH